MSKTVEPKGRVAKQRASILAADSPEDSDIGQADEKSWRSEIIKSASQVDLAQSDDEDELHSRLLTKKQLSEMAWGVRELSRRLSSMRIRFRVKTIFLLTKIHDADLISRTRELTKWLLSHERDVDYTVYVEEKFKDNKKFNALGMVEELSKEALDAGQPQTKASDDVISKRLRYWDEDMCRNRPHMFDFAITLGGDGTVLYASWLFQRIVPPVLSFSLGSLGFLTKFDFEEHRTILESAFNKGVTVSLRLRFEGTIMRSQQRKRLADAEESSSSQDDDGHKPDLVEELVGEEREDEHTHKPDGTFEILNEIVVDRGPNPSESLANLSCRLDSGQLTCLPQQQCRIRKYLVTMSTSLPSWQMAFACRPQPALPPTIWRPAALSATPRTQLCSSPPSVLIRFPSAQSSYQTPSSSV